MHSSIKIGNHIIYIVKYIRMLTPLVLSCFLILKRVQVLQTYRIYIIDHIFYASEANHQFEHDIYVTSIYFELLMGLVERASEYILVKDECGGEGELSGSHNCLYLVQYLCNICTIFV